MDDWKCPACGLQCKHDDDAVFCASCSKWFHIKCEEVSMDNYNSIAQMDQDFLCRDCTCVNGDFQYRLCLDRLRTDIQDIRNRAFMESVLMRTHPLCTPSVCKRMPIPGLTVDTTSKNILSKFDTTTRIPVHVSGDGSCLFNSASVSLYGNESMAIELRARTAIELILFKENYDASYPELRKLYDIQEAITDTVTFGYSSAFTIAALSEVLQHPISSVYPPLNGLLDPAFRILTTTFSPNRSAVDKETLYIMWTRVGEMKGNWFPNHFVPLLCVEDLDENIIDLSPPSPGYFECMSSETDDYVCLNRSTDVFDECIEKEKTEDDIPANKASDQCFSFLTVRQAFDILISDTPASPTIPAGQKGNCMFILENSDNETKRQMGQQSDFTDDMGVWDSRKGSTKKTEFLFENEKMIIIEKNQGVYFKNKKKPETRLQPQPPASDIFVIKRYHATLKRDNNVKKHITWIEKVPPAFIGKMGRAVVEYKGTTNSTPNAISVHGNSKNGNEYIRTSQKVRNDIKEAMLRRAPPTQTYSEMVLNNSTDCPRDTKQVYNMKQNMKEKTENRQNSADYLQTAISEFHNSDFVQHIVPNKKTPPSFVLYYDQQLDDIVRFCSTDAESPSPLGVDRTFNMGQCYVTCMVYKNTRLLRKTSNEPPIFMGPVFLHFDGRYETYHSFFSHIQAKMDKSNIHEIQSGGSSLIIGSDEEKAMTKALKVCFPKAKTLLCTQHLQDNTQRKLNDIPGQKVLKNQIIQKIYGPSSIVEADTSADFEERANEVLEIVEGELPDFKNYVSNIIQQIKVHVVEPRLQCKAIPLSWKNNNCESMNHIMKVSIEWKPKAMPDLIDNIQRIIDMQNSETKRALHGTGNYMLHPSERKFQVPHQIWATKSAEEKEGHLRKFSNARKRKRENVVLSTDGMLEVPTTQQLAKKPCQRTRAKGHRTKQKFYTNKDIL